jgi:anti-sigma factor RsiW
MMMRLDCEEIRDLLSALADGELDSARRKAVSAHLLTCDECSTIAGRLAGARGLVQRDEADAEVPAGFIGRLQDRLDEMEGVESMRRRVRQPGPARRITAVAAAGAIAVSLALILSTVFFMNDDRALELT